MTDICLSYPINCLVSFHYFEKHNIREMNNWGLSMIGDSGAFSAASQGTPINIRAFADWAKKWRGSLSWIASLDVIGDAQGSRKNFDWLRNEGIDVIPTVHYGADPSLISDYVKDGVDFIGLGGMVGRKSEPKRLLRWALSMFKYARDNHPEVRFHGWGVTHPDLVMNLPWFSVDSSGFSSAYRFGRLSLFDPRTAKKVGISLDGSDINQHSELLRNVYLIDPARVSISTRETRRDLVRLSVSAVQQQEAYLQRRHKVSAPEYGLLKTNSTNQSGPRVHFVDAAKVHLSMLAPPTGGPLIHCVNGGIKDYEYLKEIT